MTSPATSPSKEDLLAEVGRDETTRNQLVAALADWEKRYQAEGADLRETVTGPLVDALYSQVGAVTRRLSSGLNFTMPYRSKIAREFAMGAEPLVHVWEPQTTRLLLALADRASTVVVGGAYCGDHSIPMADILKGTGGKVHCFELHPVQLEALKANAEANGLSNVVVNSMGLWNQDGFVRLAGDDSHATPVWSEGEADGAFPVTTIDSYAGQHGIETVGLIMLDIEGGELAALRGADRFLAQPAETAPNIVFEIHASYVDWSNGIANTDLLQLLIGHGYRVYGVRDYQAHVDMTGLPLELVDIDDIYLEGPPHGFNMFATKRPELVEELGFVVRRGVSPKLLRHRLSEIHQPGSARS